jgi:hypothetical protein
MSKMEQIEMLTMMHAEARRLLGERMASLTAEMDTAKRRRLPGIRAALSAAKDSRERLASLIDESRTEFEKPRTRVFHGIKVGITKGKGKVQFADGDEVVKRIRRLFPDDVPMLINTVHTPIKAGLVNLTAAELKSLGCEVVGAGDFIVVSPADSELDKLVDALLAEPARELEEDQ